MARPEWIEVGRVTRAHGVRGEVRVALDSDNPERFKEGSVLHARPAHPGLAGAGRSRRLRLTVETVRGGGAFPIVSFQEVKAREQAEALRGHLLEVRAGELPALDEDEFYPFDLEGLAVVDLQGVSVGHVSDVIDSPAHGLLEVTLVSGDKVLVPFVSAAVPAVLMEKGCLVIDPRFLEASG